jgi:hypothetical protein
MSKYIQWLAALALVTACNSNSADKDGEGDTDDAAAADPSGLWQTKRQRVNGTSCASPGEDIIPIPFFDLRRDGDRLDFYTCTAADNCAPTPDDLWSYSLVDGFWVGESRNGSVSEQEQACRMFLQSRYLELSDGKLTLERLDYVSFLAGVVDESDCTAEANDWNGGGGECAPYEILTANRVGAESE